MSSSPPLMVDLIGGATSAFSAPELISDMIDRQDDLLRVLRLVSLQCQVHGGLPSKVYTQYQKDICQVTLVWVGFKFVRRTGIIT